MQQRWRRLRRARSKQHSCLGGDVSPTPVPMVKRALVRLLQVARRSFRCCKLRALGCSRASGPGKAAAPQVSRATAFRAGRTSSDPVRYPGGRGAQAAAQAATRGDLRCAPLSFWWGSRARVHPRRGLTLQRERLLTSRPMQRPCACDRAACRPATDCKAPAQHAQHAAQPPCSMQSHDWPMHRSHSGCMCCLCALHLAGHKYGGVCCLRAVHTHGRWRGATGA